MCARGGGDSRGGEMKATEDDADDDHVSEWEKGLPTNEELMPLSQSLISPALASAFSIRHEPAKTPLDVQHGARATRQNLRNQKASIPSFGSYPSFQAPDKLREDGDSAGCPENSSEEPNARTLKRPRLVWTPQLHKRFVDAVGHLGIKNAVPKTIMQLMNVEGLTRENVASHLQKYRLYLKRVQGLSSEGPSASDQLFASTPLPPNLGGLHYVHNHRDDVGAPPFASPNVPMPYTAVAPCPMGPSHYSGYEHHPYSGVGRGMPQQSPQSDDQREQQITANENHHNHSHNYNNQTHNQPSSPPQHILTLFPTSSR
ncbi:unnamed protein product [Sphagnum jensenii]|uniref:HTH myb-type domain-containing protein n=1 Tax=Sphagnum jensenii TaxID=128206 RepID=A0ABP0XEC8_9BRYO